MNPKLEIERLLNRSWTSFEELYGAVRKVIGREFRFDCFEEWKQGEVIIRSNPIGFSEFGFDFHVELKSAAIAA